MNNDLRISKADKGNSIVVLDNSDYINKVNDVLNDNNFKLLKNDPTAMFSKNVNTLIQNSNLLFKDDEKRYLRIMNPQSPRLYGLPKLHKPSIPIRPVVSFTNAPTYKLAQKANTIFKNVTNFKSKFCIKNSLNLVNKIINVKVPLNSKLVSFDVKSLFTSIPILDCKNIIHEMLLDANCEKEYADQLKNVLYTCMDQNCFKFNNYYYQQLDGLAMGSPLSPLLAEIFMANFENKLFNSNNPLLTKIIYWYRYVDDVICLFNGTSRQLYSLLNLINSVNKCIQFTMEVGENDNINFLDLNISIKNSNHYFNIFRKPTYTDAVIPASSNHPISHKHAAFYNMIHRLVTLPLSPTDFYTELNTIKQIAINNGYSVKLIDTILNKKQKLKIDHSLYTANCDGNDKIKYCRIKFINNVSYEINKLIIDRSKYKPAFYCSNNVGRLIVNNKDKRERLDNSGVYKISCGDCSCEYVGQSGRSINKRIKEHISSWKYGKSNSNFANHLLETGHTFNPKINVKLLHMEEKSRKLNNLECLEINRSVFKNHTYNLNDQIFLNPSPLLKPIM